MTDARPVGLALENRLMSHGIYVTEWTLLPAGDGAAGDDTATAEREAVVDHGADADGLRDGTGLALEYETVAETPGVGSEEVGAVVRALLAIGDERDWVPGRVEATSMTTDGTVRGHWHVERAWFDGLGVEFDDLEFSQRVLGTRRAGDPDE